MALVKDPHNIKLAMLGMVAEDGHPYSWSAIINGRYDAEVMADCGYPVIPQYLGAAPPKELGIDGAQVTHIWCDDPEDAQKVAKASCIANIVDAPEQVIGQVDAVIIPTDKGWEHLDRARPFIEAGLPVFIDKPLTDREDHLRQFVRWQRDGRPIMSTSCMRYAREYAELKQRLDEVGELRLITMKMAKSWERYGIHALEGVYPLLCPGGWRDAINTGDERSNHVHIRHASGVDVLISVVEDLFGGFGHMNVYGTDSSIDARFKDSFHAFRTQLVTFVQYLRTGKLPFDFAETVELMKLVIAGIRSRHEGGRRVPLTEIAPDI